MDASGDFGLTKNDILDDIFLVSLNNNMLVAQYKIDADMKSTLNFSMKRVYHNKEKYCISFYSVENQYIFVHLQIKYLSIARQ